MFNDFLLNIRKECHGKHLCKFVNNENDNTMFIVPTTDSERISAFLSLNNRSSCDARKWSSLYSSSPYQICIGYGSSYLTYLLNICLTAGVFRSRMKLAKVTLIHKKVIKTVPVIIVWIQSCLSFPKDLKRYSIHLNKGFQNTVNPHNSTIRI